MHEPGREQGGEEPLAICVNGLLGVPEVHPPPGMGQQQSQGTPSAPALMSHLLLHLRPLQLGGEKGKSGSSGVSHGAALMAAPYPLAANLAGLLFTETAAMEESWGPVAIMLPCNGCQVPGAGQAPQCQSPWTYVPGPTSLPGCGWQWCRSSCQAWGWSPPLPGSSYLSTCTCS